MESQLQPQNLEQSPLQKLPNSSRQSSLELSLQRATMEILILKGRCFDLQETITALRTELARVGGLAQQQNETQEPAE